MIKEICGSIVQVLKDVVFPRYTSETWIEIAHGFERKSKFPNILGALDGNSYGYHYIVKKTLMNG